MAALPPMPKKRSGAAAPMRWLVVLLVGLLAGCADDPSDVEPAFDDIVPEGATGVMRGVVFDGAIIPLQGVTVTEAGGAEATTDDQGRWVLTGFDASTYVLTFSKPGYAQVQAAAEVVETGDAPILKVQMAILPGTEPFVEVMQWNGHIECSWFLANVFYTGCGIGDVVGDQSRRFDMINARPHFVQSELDWTPTQVAGSNLCMRHYASSGIGGDILGDVCGANPLTFHINETKVEEVGIGNTRGIERVVWVASLTQEAPVAGVAIDQPFVIYTHLFFNFQPDDGWTFLANGPPTVPT